MSSPTYGLIILLCRNAVKLSAACLDTLLNQDVPVHVLAVDNASTDETPQHLRFMASKHSNLFRMTLAPVHSVAAAWNRALNWAWARRYTEALVVNSDTELLRGTYRILQTYLDVDKARSDRITGMVTAVGVDKDPQLPLEINERPHPDYSCYMITRHAHRRVPFNEDYEGAYFEDADHHVRMHRAGLYACSINLGFLHHSSGTLKHADPREQERINRNYDANKQRFLAEYGCVPGGGAYEKLFAAPVVPREPNVTEIYRRHP